MKSSEILAYAIQGGALVFLYWATHMWIVAYRELQINKDLPESRIFLLDKQLTRYMLFLGFTVCVAVAIECVKHFWPVPQITIAVSPYGKELGEHLPTLKKDGQDITQSIFVTSGTFSEELKSKTNYEVNVIKMRDYLIKNKDESENCKKLSTQLFNQELKKTQATDAGF